MAELQCGHGTKAVENVTVPGLPATLTATALQCGHGTKAVENLRIQNLSTADDAMLQCGHGTKAVENPASAASDWLASYSSFNAATARRPWRTAACEVLCPQDDMLQCGHGTKAVENRSHGQAVGHD